MPAPCQNCGGDDTETSVLENVDRRLEEIREQTKMVDVHGGRLLSVEQDVKLLLSQVAWIGKQFETIMSVVGQMQKAGPVAAMKQLRKGL